MTSRVIHLWIKAPMNESIDAFFSIYEGMVVIRHEDHYFCLQDKDPYHPLDMNLIREKLLEDEMVDFVAFIEPLSQGFDPNPLIHILSKLPGGVYTIETLIPKIVLENHLQARQSLKNYYYSLVGPESIQTIISFIRNDLNATHTARQLYIHRNTLIYRLDQFVHRTTIDIRTFRGAFAIYLLFIA
ncbi:MAG: helix-turn-helix domain-containing protein [Candidatus Izemoplasmatales bacterium]|nr:helix-turn-helix domain-containing protein [Candidatus Izemoplasmatales bacterium]